MRNIKCPDCGGKKDYRAIRCSSCRYKFHWSGKNNPLYNPIRNLCKDCRQEISSGKHKRCTTCYHKIRTGVNHPLYSGGRKMDNCIDCNKPVQKKRKRCRKCWGINMGKNQRGKNNPSYIDGNSGKSSYSYTFLRQIRDRIRVRDNFQCQLCGVPELELIRRLSVHHIDYDKTNNEFYNLVSLCITCHNKTNGNREKWRAYFGYVKKAC